MKSIYRLASSGVPEDTVPVDMPVAVGHGPPTFQRLTVVEAGGAREELTETKPAAPT